MQTYSLSYLLSYPNSRDAIASKNVALGEGLTSTKGKSFIGTLGYILKWFCMLFDNAVRKNSLTAFACLCQCQSSHLLLLLFTLKRALIVTSLFNCYQNVTDDC